MKSEIQDSYIQHLIDNLELERKAQQDKFSASSAQDLKVLKREGIVLHPVKVTKKTYGYAEYPEFSFRLPYNSGGDQFREGALVELFLDKEEAIKGMLLMYQGMVGEMRLYASDFPDWIDENGVGIRLIPDAKTFDMMSDALKELAASKNAPAYPFYAFLHKENPDFLPVPESYEVRESHELNESQNSAVKAINSSLPVLVVHGPPGTGKTTTLVHAVAELVQNGEKVLVTAPSNAATDHIALRLIGKGIKVLRVGNTTKVNSQLLPHTVEGKMLSGNEQKQLKKLRIQAEEYRKMSHQYKRNFGKEEREQRKLLIQEVKNIRKEIKALQNFYVEKWVDEASVICGTPVALNDPALKGKKFQTLIIDEAGQCLEPMAWIAVKDISRMVLAGDHHQLPPTVISEKAADNGLNRSFLEVVAEKNVETVFLDTQYRMRENIAAFPNEYFYENRLKTPEELKNTGLHIHFIDTAGTGFEESREEDNASISNEGELQIIEKIIEESKTDLQRAALISPYSGQVVKAKEMFPGELRIATIDSFQGQEQEVVFLSLVRSNENGTLGFLKDYRRLNVALTRAKQELYIVGDSVTLGNDLFFKSFLNYIEKKGAYQSAWEYMM